MFTDMIKELLGINYELNLMKHIKNKMMVNVNQQCSFSRTVTRPVKTGYICENYMSSENDTFLGPCL